MKRRAYTIIELLIALAITALILTLAIPRYDSYEYQLSLQDQVQQIANCMQQANHIVNAPPPTTIGNTPLDHDSVTLAYQNSTSTTTCVIRSFDSTNTEINTTNVSGGQMSTETVGSNTVNIVTFTANTYLCSAQMAGGTTTNITTNQSVNYSLFNRTAGVISSASVNGTTVPTGSVFGVGQPFALVFTTSSTNCPSSGSPTGATGTVTVPASGSPVEVKTQDA